jgi:hypothetical protein
VPYFEKEVDIPSNHKLLLHGPSTDASYGHGGIAYQFKRGTMKPTYIRYKVHPYPDYHEIERDLSNYAQVGHFWIGGYTNGTAYLKPAVEVFFWHDSSGMGSLSANSGRFPEGQNTKISVDNSFLIELRNIHWETSPTITFDLWINGSGIETCITFKNPIDSITYLSLHNGSYGRVHFDDIFMADLPVDYNCPVVSENPPGPDTMPLPPLPSPTFTREPIIFIINTPAFCRSGPGTNYPKLSTFPEGTQLPITGQNLEGSWWWSEDSGCWISDIVGDLVGPWQLLPIILPSPPPPESEPADDGPGQPAGCHKWISQDACITSGGTWDDQPGQPGTCICP